MNPPPQWQQEIRYLGGSPEAELKLFQQFAEEVRQIISKSKRPGSSLFGRPQHAKTLVATRRAEFRVSPEIPKDLQVGFLIPGHRYPAYVRFSNASGKFRSSDNKKDLRGVAIRVLAGNRKEHDWLLGNSECNYARDASEAMITFIALYSDSWVTRLLDKYVAKDGRIPDPFCELAELADKIAAIRNVISRAGLRRGLFITRALIRQVNATVESLATETFWSRTAIAFGPVAVKYQLQPQQPKSNRPTPESLHDELAGRLLKSPVSYDFMVQRYLDPQRTPIEDTTKPWLSPPEKIAELVLLQQDLDDDESRADAELVNSLGLNPWRVGSSKFEPLGNINRLRKRIYPKSYKSRQL